MTGRLINDPRRAGDDPGLWIEATSDLRHFAGRPALFLDRDGVINVDSGYPSRPEDISIIEAIVAPIVRANERGWPTVVVTNQSGIARGFFDWDAFSAVTAHIHAEMAARGARLDLVLACAYVKGGQGPLDVEDHPMRKPNPGMLLRAAKIIGLDLPRSVLVGDRDSDFAAAVGAGLGRGFVGASLPGSMRFSATGFTLAPLDDLVEAIG